MPTVSAYMPDELKEKLDRVIGEEQRNQAQVGRAAFELYTSLPLPARRAFQDLVASEERGGSEAFGEAVAAMTRALLSARWRLTDEQIVAEARERGHLPEGEVHEEEVASLATDIADRVEARHRPPPAVTRSGSAEEGAALRRQGRR